MTERSRKWVPAAILLGGCLLNASVLTQRSMPLAGPLESIPLEIAGYTGRTDTIPAAQLKVAGPTKALLRSYWRDSTLAFTIYIGYYDRQRQGTTIHSPKNCLPGAGWEPLEASSLVVPVENRPVRVNRFIIANKTDRALVFYWYQGRGRTESNEYKVKLDLIRDSALHRRSDESLVRVLLPLLGSAASTTAAAAADSLGHQIIRELQPQLARILPT